MKLSDQMKQYIPTEIFRILTFGKKWDHPTITEYVVDWDELAQNGDYINVAAEIAVFNALHSEQGRNALIQACTEVLNECTPKGIGFITKYNIRNTIRLIEACAPGPKSEDAAPSGFPEEFVPEGQNMFKQPTFEGVLDRLLYHGKTNIRYHAYELYGESKILGDLADLGYKDVQIDIDLPLTARDNPSKIVVNGHNLWVYAPETPTVILTLR